MKILIVDDHPGMRAMIRELAVQPGDTVCECADGEAALTIARDFFPDVVTMDVRLPGLGGLEATRILRTAFPKIHIVVVSAYDQPAVRHVARHSGASGFIAKDHLEQLRPLVAHYRALGERSPTGATRPESIVWKHST